MNEKLTTSAGGGTAGKIGGTDVAGAATCASGNAGSAAGAAGAAGASAAVDFAHDKPQIDYPCFWEYKIFAPLGADVAGLVAGLLGEAQHTLAPSKSNAKFASFNLRVWVENDTARLELFSLLRHNFAFVL